MIPLRGGENWLLPVASSPRQSSSPPRRTPIRYPPPPSWNSTPPCCVRVCLYLCLSPVASPSTVSIRVTASSAISMRLGNRSQPAIGSEFPRRTASWNGPLVGPVTEYQGYTCINEKPMCGSKTRLSRPGTRTVPPLPTGSDLRMYLDDGPAHPAPQPLHALKIRGPMPRHRATSPMLPVLAPMASRLLPVQQAQAPSI